MDELALHLLDLLMNSVEAGSTAVSVVICEELAKDVLVMEVSDDGRGIDEAMVDKVLDPFSTTRRSRRVGLGLALLDMAARQCEGGVRVESQRGRGTRVVATFQHSHVDRAPLGDLAQTLAVFLAANPGVSLTYRHEFDGARFLFDSVEWSRRLGDTSFGDPAVAVWLRSHLAEGLQNLYGGARG